MSVLHRRGFLETAMTAAAAAVHGANIGPRLGVIAGVTGKSTPDQAIARVHAFGLPTCQVSVGMAPASLATPLKDALTKYGVEATAVMTQGSGRMVWDFYDGPRTIGIVPPETRAARIDALKRASDLGKACGIRAVHTHCGFIPENPNDAIYKEAVDAIREVAVHCKSKGLSLRCETGQETPITLVRAIRDVGTGNVGVNFDAANLVMYGKANPVDAVDLLGPYIQGVHAKDGVYPTDPRKLGAEVPIGKGVVNWPVLVEKLKAIGYANPLTIEREIRGEKQTADILAAKTFLEKLIG
jgi:sugar phosphate isomerase/epimerase